MVLAGHDATRRANAIKDRVCRNRWHFPPAACRRTGGLSESENRTRSDWKLPLRLDQNFSNATSGSTPQYCWRSRRHIPRHARRNAVPFSRAMTGAFSKSEPNDDSAELRSAKTRYGELTDSQTKRRARLVAPSNVVLLVLSSRCSRSGRSKMI
jgi:hypothetical protein